jgi:hypothetical protein
MFPVLSQTTISLLQTAGHNSPALSMDLAGCSYPAVPSVVSVKSFDSMSETTVKFINLSSVFNNMQEDENDSGEYYSLNSNIWKLLEINRKSDSRGRIHVNEKNFGKDIRVFVSDVNQELETCKHYVLLPQSVYTEVRKSRIKKHVGEPLKVQKRGDVWMGAVHKNKFVKVFVRIDKE